MASAWLGNDEHQSPKALVFPDQGSNPSKPTDPNSQSRRRTRSSFGPPVWSNISSSRRHLTRADEPVKATTTSGWGINGRLFTSGTYRVRASCNTVGGRNSTPLWLIITYYAIPADDARVTHWSRGPLRHRDCRTVSTWPNLCSGLFGVHCSVVKVAKLNDFEFLSFHWDTCIIVTI